MEELQETVTHPIYSKGLALLAEGKDAAAVPMFEQMVVVDDPEGIYVKLKESSIYKLGELYTKLSLAKKLRELLVNIRPFFSGIPKAKTAKIVRTLIDMVGNIPNSRTLQIALCKESIEWCNQEKRSFLRQRVESKLVSLMLEEKEFKNALSLVNELVREVKRIDDKLLLVEVHLVESKIHLALKNLPKSKAALTSARAASNAIYCPPGLQAEIDEQSGTLCAMEGDYKTSFSYFFEAFESFTTVSEPSNALRMLKYMMLTKIMVNSPGEVFSIAGGKSGMKHAGAQVEAMKAIASAYKKRSLHDFEKSLKDFSVQLQEDPMIQSQLSTLYENLLEKNLLRILEPFSKIETEHVATLIALPLSRVETKLSEMILDGKLNGTLDQGSGFLILFDETAPDQSYTAALNTVKELSTVVDCLYIKANRLGV